MVVSHYVLVFLYQFILHSSKNKQESIVRYLLRFLVKAVRPEESSYTEPKPFNASAEVFLENIFDAPEYILRAALMAFLIEGLEKELLVVFDGLENAKDETGRFIKDIRAFCDELQRRVPKMKVLFTSQPQDDIKEIFNGLPYIEHDMERRGKAYTPYEAVN